jgi:hypothetical protein
MVALLLMPLSPFSAQGRTREYRQATARTKSEGSGNRACPISQAIEN